MSELTKGIRLADRYTLEAPLGRGGDAATWLAKDRLTRASVALKIVPASRASRLREEWQTNLRLMHAHIVRVFEFHEDQGFAFYSLQFIDGADIGAVAGNELEDVLPPVGLLADALRYAHGKDVVHRDVKASNVLLDYNGVPYLTDFGVAAAIGRRVGGGSPVATSPQARRGEPASPADDIYALGVLIHELVAGVPPEEGVTLAASSGQAIPGAIVALVERMLDEDASKRPSAAEVADRRRLQARAGAFPGGGAPVRSGPGDRARHRRYALIDAGGRHGG